MRKNGGGGRGDRPPPPDPITEASTRMMMRHLDGLTHNLGVTVLSIALLFGPAALRGAGAKEQDGAIVALAYDPGTDTLLKAYAGALFRSGEGKSWQKIAIPSVKNGRIAAIAVSRASKGLMYITGPSLGVLRTDNGGKTWVERSKGLPSRDVIAVAAHTTQPDTLYAALSDRGVYRSQDRGKTWRLMDRGPQEGMRQLIHSDMAGSMKTGWLFAATPKRIRRVMDCFCLWQDAGKLVSEAYSITYDPKQPQHIYTATDKGLFRSTDGGENWIEITSPSSKVVALAFAHSGTLYAINADGRLFRSADQGSTWNQVNA